MGKRREIMLVDFHEYRQNDGYSLLCGDQIVLYTLALWLTIELEQKVT